jgi:hypothetical protein
MKKSYLGKYLPKYITPYEEPMGSSNFVSCKAILALT